MPHTQSCGMRSAHFWGTASDSPVTVRALLYIIAGHERHHLAVLKERYGV